MIGQVVGSYRITAPLGAGGMGEVWHATHVLLGSAAAIKVLKPECSESKSIVQRFFDEARAATRIDHPSIVTVFDFGWLDGRAYLIMELLRGETLARAIRAAGTLPPARALRLLRRCADAMAAAHAAGIVHRDLKPDNLFLIPDPLDGERVKILDFGIAKLLGDDPGHLRTQTGMIMGTPAYMSPEQCRGASGVDHRTDVYALGCVLFHMLTGRPPFLGATAADLIAAHLTAEAPAVSALVFGISSRLDALVARCLAKDADARIGSMPELAAAIEATLAAQVAEPAVAPATRGAGGAIGSTAPVGSMATLAAPVAAAPGAPLPPTGASSAPFVAGGGTTMQRGAGESLAPAPPRRRGTIGLAFVVAALAIGATTVAVVTSTRARRPAAAADAALAAPVDAGVALDAAAAAAVAVDASVAVDAAPGLRVDVDASTRPPTGRPTGPRRGGGSGSGSGTRPVPSTGSGSGSGTRPVPSTGSGSGSAYDPYEDR